MGFTWNLSRSRTRCVSDQHLGAPRRERPPPRGGGCLLAPAHHRTPPPGVWGASRMPEPIAGPGASANVDPGPKHFFPLKSIYRKYAHVPQSAFEYDNPSDTPLAKGHQESLLKITLAI